MVGRQGKQLDESQSLVSENSHGRMITMTTNGVDEMVGRTRHNLRSQHHWIDSEPNVFAGKVCISKALARFSERENTADL
jgi:hypothetical protein